jgi:hypothetical protein
MIEYKIYLKTKCPEASLIFGYFIKIRIVSKLLTTPKISNKIVTTDENTSNDAERSENLTENKELYLFIQKVFYLFLHFNKNFIYCLFNLEKI